MYEFHCWTVLSYHSHDTNNGLQAECVKACEKYLSTHRVLSPGNYKVVTHNGMTTFLLSGAHNHYANYVLEIFTWLGQFAPGSYGVLYTSDDEDSEESEVFKVYVMRKGQVTKQPDTFFSPRVPFIEDPYDEARID